MANKSTKNTDLDINKDTMDQEVEAPVETVSSEVRQEEVVDVQIKEAPKKLFRINGNDNRLLALNTNDISIAIRLRDGYNKLANVMKDIASIDINDLDSMSEFLQKADQEMRNLLDYIFDANVSEICAPIGSMYDPYNGTFRYEAIIDSLTKLYESDLNAEYKKIRARIQKHTKKYTK